MTLTLLPTTRTSDRIEQLHLRSHLLDSRDFVTSQNPDIDVELAWQKLDAIARHSVVDNSADIMQLALAFYNSDLRSTLEASNSGEYVALHPDTRTYKVERLPGKAFRALRVLCPHGSIVIHHIGIASANLRDRIRGEHPS